MAPGRNEPLFLKPNSFARAPALCRRRRRAPAAGERWPSARTNPVCSRTVCAPISPPSLRAPLLASVGASLPSQAPPPPPCRPLPAAPLHPQTGPSPLGSPRQALPPTLTPSTPPRNADSSASPDSSFLILSAPRRACTAAPSLRQCTSPFLMHPPPVGRPPLPPPPLPVWPPQALWPPLLFPPPALPLPPGRLGRHQASPSAFCFCSAQRRPPPSLRPSMQSRSAYLDRRRLPPPPLLLPPSSAAHRPHQCTHPPTHPAFQQSPRCPALYRPHHPWPASTHPPRAACYAAHLACPPTPSASLHSTGTPRYTAPPPTATPSFLRMRVLMPLLLPPFR